MKIACLIPRYGDTKGEFTISLARMISGSLRAQPRLEIETFSVASADLIANRTFLLQRAIAWQARYALWLDADHAFPPDALLRLLRHGLAVVGCNYLRRAEPLRPVAARLDGQGSWEHVWTSEEQAKRGAVEEVSHVGLGLCLMDLNLLHQVKAHVDRDGPAGWANWQPFERRPDPVTGTPMGEDASFFMGLREAGVKVHVDHGLSWQVGHIGERIMTNAMAQRAKGDAAPLPR